MLHKGPLNTEGKERQSASRVDSNAILGQEVDSAPEEVREIPEVC